MLQVASLSAAQILAARLKMGVDFRAVICNLLRILNAAIALLSTF